METAGTDQVVTYLSRLTGETLAADTPLRLRSVQRAAFSSWARQQQLTLRLAVISSTVPFSVRELMASGDGVALVEAAAQSSANAIKIGEPASIVSLGAATGAPVVGIDIEEVDNLPEAIDYREHPFYQDNFTAAEISYCVRQSDVRSSLCGTWAAKEAILKAGVKGAPTGHLRAIEIGRDSIGRPLHPGCSISISHTARTAVAICSAVLAIA